jgi:hypothetical protein
MLDWLNNFDLGRWWIAAIAVGVAVEIAAAATKDHGIALVGFGIAACGFGEWMNHRMETAFMNRGTLMSYHRVNRPTGVVLDGLGFILIAVGLYRVLVSEQNSN